MNCYDCALDGTIHEAVAVCIDCGAAACLEHSHSELRWLTRTAVIYRLEPVEPAARSIRCDTCATAHYAVDHPAAHPAGHPAVETADHIERPLSRLLASMRR